MTVLLAVIAAITPTPAQETPAPYWTRVRGCGHGHDYQPARRRLDQLLLNHRPLTPATRTPPPTSSAARRNVQAATGSPPAAGSSDSGG